MPSEKWIRGEALTQSTCGYSSILINILLMSLIYFKSPPKLGNYKWLMLYTSLFELVYAFLTLFAGPHVLTHASAFIVFQDMDKFIYSHQVGKFLIWAYCSCFGFSMAMFASHFLYRYSTIDIGTVFENYRIEIDNCAYISAHFWPVDTFGNRYADFHSFLGVAIMQVVVGSSLGSVLFFGVKCYLWLTRKLKSIGTLSDASKSLQTQLLHALIIQTVIPCVLMYLPATIVFIFPMLNIELNTNYPIIIHAVAIYPAIDPLPTILIIKSYRRGFIELLRRFTCRGEFQIKGYLNRQSNTVNPVSFTASA